MNLRLLLLVAGALWAAPCLAAAQPEGGNTFPQESLVGRIAKIMDAFRVDITYEEALVRGATAPAVQGASSADEALGGSLRGNGLAYRKLNDKSYVIVRGTETADGKWEGKREKGSYPISDDPEKIRFINECYAKLDADGDTSAFVRNILGRNDFWGQDLTAVPGLADAVSDDLAAIRREGVVPAVEQLLEA